MRAYRPWPGTFLDLRRAASRVLRAAVAPGSRRRRPGNARRRRHAASPSPTAAGPPRSCWRSGRPAGGRWTPRRTGAGGPGSSARGWDNPASMTDPRPIPVPCPRPVTSPWPRRPRPRGTRGRASRGSPRPTSRRSWRSSASPRSGPGRSPTRCGARTAADWDEVTTLARPLRAALAERLRFDTLRRHDLRVADGGTTEKALHRLSDGRLVESVLMHYPGGAERRERNTLCISSQAGCAVGCPFCATGELGFERDLDVAEIVDQVRHARRRLTAAGRHLTNVVFMGMGEPLLNLDAVLEAAAVLTDPARFGLGARHVTISTSGVVPGIERLTRLHPAVDARGQPPRRARRAAGSPRAAQPALAGGRGRRRGHGLRARDRPPGELRVRDDRRDQRHAGRRRRAGGAPPRDRGPT